MIESDLYTYLCLHPGLSALVGNRIYPGQAPKGVTLPYIVFFKVSNIREFSHQGFVSLQKPRIQISCYGDRYYTSGLLIGVKQVAEQVILAMEAWTGYFGIQASQLEGEEDLVDRETNLYHIPLDFFICYGDAAGSGWSPPSFPVDGINKIIKFDFQGTISPDMVSGIFHFQAGVTIEKIALHVQDVHSGDNITIDILKNSIPQTRIATLIAGAKDQETIISLLAVNSTDEFGVKILTTGSIEPGAGLEVRVFYK